MKESGVTDVMQLVEKIAAATEIGGESSALTQTSTLLYV